MLNNTQNLSGFNCPIGVIVKQNCFWKTVVRRTQDVRSMASIHPYAEEKEHFLFAYDAPMVFQIHFCLTIKASAPSVFRWPENKFRPFLEGAQPMVHPQEMGETRYNRARNLAIKVFGLRIYFFAFACAAFGCGFSKSAYRLASANSLRASFICLSLTSMCLMRPFWK